MKEYLRLFLVFAKISVTTFGGGYAMMPILIRELVDIRKWSTVDEILDYFAVSQCTPGIIAVNVATFIGYKRKGKLGGVIATLGVVTPSLVIMSIVAILVNTGIKNQNVEHMFSGIRLVAIALILHTVILMIKKNIKSIFSGIAFVTALILTLFLGISPIIVVVIAVIMGIINFLLIREEYHR